MDFKDISFNDENFNNKTYLYNYIKQEIDNMGFLKSNLKMRKVGTLYRSICPFHNEKTASFTVYPNDNSVNQKYASFYCFGCGATGDIIKFKQLKDNLTSYYEAALQLAIEYKLDIQNENEIKLNYLQSQLNIMDNINNLSLDKINLICSTILRNYLQKIKNQNYFNEYFDKVNQYYKYLDSELEERNAIQAQSLINETIQFVQKEGFNEKSV